MSEEEFLRFVPSKVEGLPNVTEVVVHSDRLEFLSAGRWVIFRLDDIAEWPRPKWLRRLLARFGRCPDWLLVGDKDWFHPPSERFFRFYTQPEVTVYMPLDEQKEHQESNFRRVQEVMRKGGFSTFDLG
jgi:hypothetical protein